tara:strand:+ start:457 stop:639 length:183 start_codon:yes stop_codon:yes gene_type:complete
MKSFKHCFNDHPFCPFDRDVELSQEVLRLELSQKVLRLEVLRLELSEEVLRLELSEEVSM